MSMRSAWKFGRRAAALTLVTLAANRADAGGMYGVTGLSGSVYGIDNAGQVLTSGGLYQNGVTTPLAIPTSPYWRADAVISPGGTIAYQGTDSYGFETIAHVIRNGQDFNAGFVENADGGTEGSTPRAVNDAGIVVGASQSRHRFDQAYVSTPGPDGKYQPVSLGANGGTVSTATAINNSGTVAGWTDVVAQWKNHAFVGSTQHDIGTLGGQSSTATSINDKGQVVGWSNIATDWRPPANPQNYATPEPTHAFLYQNGKMTDLGTLAGYKDSAATAINTAGQIVGHVSNTQDAIDTRSYSLISSGVRAALFDAKGGSVVDLNDLLPRASGWVLQDATGINDSGQIIGSGTFNGVAEGFLLTPSTGDVAAVPEPGTLAIAVLGIVAVAVRRRSKRSMGGRR